MARGDKKSAANRKKAQKKLKAQMARLAGSQKVVSTVTLHPFAALPSEIASEAPKRAARGVQGGRWDHGTGTRAAMAGTVKEPVEHLDENTGKMVNPNNVTRRRRLPQIEHLARRGRISKVALAAAIQLLNAFEATQKTGPAIKAVQVDSSPKPDSNVAIMVDRVSALAFISKRMPKGYRKLIDWVVIQNQRIGDLPVCGSRARQRRKIWEERNAVANLIADREKRLEAQASAQREVKAIKDDHARAAKCVRLLNEGLEKLAGSLGR